MEREESWYAIDCGSEFGPMFGSYGCDILLGNNCNGKDSCYIGNDGTKGYECHPQYKESLFVNTAGPDNLNPFSVLDYEVFTH